MKINKGKTPRARRMLVYGENGVGKSTFAAGFPSPIFLNLEDGVGDLDVDSTDVIRSVTEFTGCLVELVESQYETIVVDTIDWLEKLIFDEVARDAGKKTIEDIGFGKGYQAVALRWTNLFDGFAYLWQQGRHVVFTCHESIEKFTNPEGDSYNYWRPSLNSKGSGCVTEWCDEVFFLRYRTHTMNKDEGFGAKRAVAIGGKERYMATTKSAAYEAKNRLGLPDELVPSFEALKPYMPPVKLAIKTQPSQADRLAGNIAGVVVDGSSKKRNVSDAVVEAIGAETPF
jgi:hypothetical protein